jgi:hypothetical protein
LQKRRVMNNDIKFSNPNWSSPSVDAGPQKTAKPEKSELSTEIQLSKSQNLENKARVIQSKFDSLFKEVHGQSRELAQTKINKSNFESELTAKKIRGVLSEEKVVQLEQNYVQENVSQKTNIEIEADVNKFQINELPSKYSNLLIDNVKTSIGEAIATRFNDLSSEDRAKEIRNFILDLNKKGLLKDAEGNAVHLSDQEVEEFIEKAIKFAEAYYNPTDVEKEKEPENEEKEELKEHTYVDQNLAALKAKGPKAPVESKDKDKILLKMLILFKRLVSAIQLERSKEKKEQLREQADIVKREMIQLKELHREESHLEINLDHINVGNINKEELLFQEVKETLNKVQEVLMPLQTFSKAIGPRAIQYAGDSSNPLKMHVVKEFNLESPFQNRLSSRDVSLVKLSDNVSKGSNGAAKAR